MYTALLQSIATFIELSQSDQALIRRLFQHRHVEQGAYILLEGEICQEVAYIASGLVRYYINQDGEALTYAFGSEGEFLCDYSSFLVKQPSRHTIEALESTELLTISFDRLQQLYQNVEQGERFGRLVVEQIFTQMLDQLTSLYCDPPRLRYERFLQQFPHLVKRLPQYYIASYIGVKPQSLSRIRRRSTPG